MSSGEDPIVTLYATDLAIQLKKQDSDKFNKLYDQYTKELNPEQIERLKEKVRVLEPKPLPILNAKYQWLEQRLVMKSSDRKSDIGRNKQNSTSASSSSSTATDPLSGATFTSSLHNTKSASPQLGSTWPQSWMNSINDVPYVDEDVDSDSAPASENRCGDFISQRRKKEVGCSTDIRSYDRNLASARENNRSQEILDNYNQNRGKPCVITIGDNDNLNDSQDSNVFRGDNWKCAGDNNIQSKNSSNDESGDSQSGARSKDNKKLRKKKRKQNRAITSETEVINAEVESRESKNGAAMTAAYMRNRRRKKWHETHAKIEEEEQQQQEEKQPAVMPTVEVSLPNEQQRPKKRSVKQFKEQKAREQTNAAYPNGGLRELQGCKEPVDTTMKVEKPEKKQIRKREEQKKKQIQEFLTEERMNEIVKSIEDVAGKKPKETKVVVGPKQNKKKSKKAKKGDQGKKNVKCNNVQQSNTSSMTGDKSDEKSTSVVESNTIATNNPHPTASDNEDSGDKEEGSFVIQRRSRKTNAKSNTSISGRNSPTVNGKRGKRRYSDPSPKTGKAQSKELPSHHQQNSSPPSSARTVAVTSEKTVVPSAKNADLTNENNWPKLEAFMPSTSGSNEGGTSVLQTGSNHQSVASYASKLKANLDSIGCSPASSGEDGNSSTSSSGVGGIGNVSNYSNCTTSPNEFDPAYHASNQNDFVSFSAAEVHLDSAASTNNKDGVGSSSYAAIKCMDSSPSNIEAVKPNNQSTEDLEIPSLGCETKTESAIPSGGDLNRCNDNKSSSSKSSTDKAISVEDTAASCKELVVTKTSVKKSGVKKDDNSTLKAASETSEVLTKQKAPGKQQFQKVQSNSQKASSTKSKMLSEKDTIVSFSTSNINATVDVNTIVENDWKFSFFYNDTSASDVSSDTALSHEEEEIVSHTLPLSNVIPDNAEVLPSNEVLESVLAESPTTNDNAYLEEKDAIDSVTSLSTRTPVVLSKPRHSQRLLNGTTVTSPWNDPGQFDLGAAQKFLLKRFQEFSKTAVRYPATNSN